MAINFSNLDLPTLPAVVRGDALDDGAKSQRDQSLASLGAQLNAAVENLIRTPEGEATSRSGTNYISAIGGTIREALQPIAGKLALNVNATYRTEVAPNHDKGNGRG